MAAPHRPVLFAPLLLLVAAAPEPPPRATLQAVNGTVQAVDLGRHVLTVQADGGAFTVTLDRNTLVYLPAGLASVADLHAGAPIRVGRDAGRACWIEVREEPARRSPTARPSQGTGPAGGGPPPADTTGPDAGAPPAGVGPAPAPGSAGQRP